MKYTSKSNSKSLKLFFSSKIDTKILFFSMDGTIIESYSYDRELKNKSWFEYFGCVIDKTENAQISMWQEKNKDKHRFDVNCL